MIQPREKRNFLVLNRADFLMIGKVPWYSVFSFLFFYLESTVKSNTWMKTISATVMVIISKVLF